MYNSLVIFRRVSVNEPFGNYEQFLIYLITIYKECLIFVLLISYQEELDEEMVNWLQARKLNLAG